MPPSVRELELLSHKGYPAATTTGCNCHPHPSPPWQNTAVKKVIHHPAIVEQGSLCAGVLVAFGVPAEMKKVSGGTEITPK